jgi:hypothetical protein
LHAPDKSRRAESGPGPADSISRYLPGLIFLVGSGSLIYEIALLRELRFQLIGVWISHIFFTSVLCLIGVGAILVHYSRRNPLTLLRDSLILLTLLAYPCFVFATKVIQRRRPALLGSEAFFSSVAPPYDVAGFLEAFLWAALVGFGVMFVLHGIVFTLIMRLSRERGVVSRVYGADLLGAGLGALLAALISFVLDPGQMVALAGVMLWSAVLLARGPLQVRIPSLAFAMSVPVLAVWIAVGTDWNVQMETRTAWRGDAPVRTAWSPYQRVDALELLDGVELYTDNWLFYQVPDPRVHPDADESDALFHHLIFDLPAAQPKRALIIGSGLGRDVISLRAAERTRPESVGPSEVKAVELDQAVISLARQIPWIWRDYGTAEVIVGEGRNFLGSTEERFDVIHYAYLDARAQISIVLLADAMFLYTEEALRIARQRLTPTGYFLAKRVVPADIEGAVVQRAVATLERAGLDERSALVALSRTAVNVPGRSFHTMYILFARGDIPGPMRADLNGVLARENIEVQPWDPGGAPPTTDQFPFSIHDGRTVVSQLASWYRTRPALTVVVFLSILIVIGASCRRTGHAQMFTIGLGFMLLESLVLVQGFLVLGNPSVSTGVALGAFLVGTGVGSLASPYLRRRRYLLFGVPLVVLSGGLVLPSLLEHLIPMTIPLRGVGFVLWVLPLSVSIGAFFPLSLQAFGELAVPGLLFVNLLGNASSPFLFRLLFTSYGYYPLALLCAALYGVGAVLLFRRLPGHGA